MLRELKRQKNGRWERYDEERIRQLVLKDSEDVNRGDALVVWVRLTSLESGWKGLRKSFEFIYGFLYEFFGLFLNSYI
ncbi:hypothetical protein OUZ56_024287 [Daphnia magna]|uniref:Uncharacterized protein n=1 Tax=Daphnia magna TaxID=35525 RepID=A0ABR0B0J7_9CRUS|nr:hypothetical protein OUZ56_024287 [Daphnia magna]